ncbi:DUF2239 family protein [Chelatococcus asaccharovorans]|uniref:DUF2239 family protein n=1 Tax=Chelatococcus asaccharovorans TaxID=28210 RepID=UPI00224C6BBF|nr:DUF2239 family protein [Chelatococcus asaccharovorans]CAH1653112.1 conserved hypothetical protein [Chelatococcus asaccharovorans]CAH1686141.1 conserved hypothetical protein [Chelatococcus asaccharovorans]
MSDPLAKLCTAFAGQRLLFSGPLGEVAIAVARSTETADAVLVFDDATGRVVDLDLRGSDAEILERLSNPSKPSVGRYRSNAGEPAAAGTPEDRQRGRGRPKLGVVAREVTLLPRQWEWLASRPGGASATLRRLVDDARKAVHPRQQRRAAQEAAYQFMLATAGDLPGYEEATRALFADDCSALEERIAAWPEDIRAYALRLAVGPSAPPDSESTTG